MNFSTWGSEFFEDPNPNLYSLGDELFPHPKFKISSLGDGMFQDPNPNLHVYASMTEGYRQEVNKTYPTIIHPTQLV